MKKIYTLIVLLLTLTNMSIGQQVLKGMKYQAIARDRGGEVFANKKISLKISLVGEGNKAKNYYTEVHELVTNNFGLFDLVIGEGKKMNGEFVAIPWSQEDIWIEVSLKDNQRSDFIVINSSKLLAVPFAYHALTAGEVVAVKGNAANRVIPYLNAEATRAAAQSPGIPSQSWSLFGNSKSNPINDKLGTTDLADLVVVTNNIQRLRVQSEGNIDIARSLKIGADLNVDSNANLNIAGGATINNGAFTVARFSPTMLTGSLTVGPTKPTLLGGTLTVDGASTLNNTLTVFGITNLNSNLNVNNESPTRLTGTLTVNGITNLNNNLNVNNTSPTVLTGTLAVDKDAVFREHVLINNPAHQSTGVTSGALVVNGGLGLGRNLNVGGNANFGGNTSFAGAVVITDVTESVSTTTGALTVGGGLGLGKRLNVGGATQLGNTLAVTGATSLSSTLGVTGATTLANTLAVTGATNLNNTLGVTGAATFGSTVGINGITNINNTTESSGPSNGALKVSGGIGVAKNVNVGGTLTTTGGTTLNGTLAANGQVTITTEVGGGESSFDGYPLRVQGSGQGIAIKVSGSRTGENNFVSFWDGNGMQGRIEGQTLDELESNRDYLFEKRQYQGDIAFGIIDVVLASYDFAVATKDVVAAATSTTACVGLGACVTAPIPSLTVAAVFAEFIAIANLAAVSTGTAFAVNNYDDFQNYKKGDIGVTYESGAGDYAEYLMKENTGEHFMSGDVIGVRGGKISKNTNGAEKVMVISRKPIVLGNMPVGGNEKDFEKVAFMGQVPVKVFGKVNVGDYIIANGNNNGVAKAISRDMMDSKNIKNIVGIAWSSAANPIQISEINVAIGLNVNDNQKLVDDLEKQVSQLSGEISKINAQLEKLIPGFAASSTSINSAAPAISHKAAHAPIHNPNAEFTAVPNETNIHYYQITREDVIKGAEMVQDHLKSHGENLMNNPFWEKYNNDLSFKNETIEKILSKHNQQINASKKVDSMHSKN